MVVQLLGQKAFAALVREYLEHHPTRNVSLAVVGENFANYISSLSFSANGELICATAKLDRSCLEALHVPDANALAPESLQDLGEGPSGHKVCFAPRSSDSRLDPTTGYQLEGQSTGAGNC